MHRQVGDLKIENDGSARRGLLLRHLLMPAGMAGTREIMRFVAQEISPDTYVNIMIQYHPAFQAHRYPEIDTCVSRKEYDQVVEEAIALGLTNLDLD